jgi:hypothetical protein
MGANAQTSVPTFTAGQVLTAAQMNDSARTGVPVFADTTARDAGFGGTGEKTLAEGQLCYLESTNVVQYYDGSSWATVGPQTISGGLTFITGATFTNATSFSLPNNTFSASYRNYRLHVTITASTADVSFTIRMRASGTDNTAGSYSWAVVGLLDNGTGSNVSANSQTSWGGLGTVDATLEYYGLALDIIAPQVAERTFMLGQYMGVTTDGLNWLARNGGWNHNSATQFDALSFISDVASSITGSYAVYGYPIS